MKGIPRRLRLRGRHIRGMVMGRGHMVMVPVVYVSEPLPVVLSVA